MPIPILGAAAGYALGAGAGLGLGVAGSFIGAALEPAVLRTRYGAYNNDPIVLPPPDAIWDAFARGHLSKDEMDRLIKVLGIEVADMAAAGRQKTRKIAWLSAMEARRPRLNPADLLRLMQRGHITDQAEFRRLWSWTLSDPKDWQPFARSEQWALTPDLYLRSWLRGTLSDAEKDKALRAAGLVSSGDRAIATDLTNQIPGISDLIMLMVRDVFDPDAVNKRGLGKGFPDELKKWGKALGYDWNLGIQTTIDDKPVDLTWLLAYWIGHWQPLSPTIARLLEIRLRPTGGPGGGPRDPSGKVWTKDDTLRALRIADYPPGEIEHLAAVNTVKPGLRQIREMHFLGVVKEENNDKGKAELSEMYRDLGYDNVSSPSLAETTIRYNSKRRGREIIGLTRAKIEQAYALGILTNAEVLNLLVEIGMSQGEAVTAYQGMALEVRMAQVKKAVAGVRRNYLLGDYQAADATAALTTLGIQPTRIADFLSIWDQEQRQYRLTVAPTTLTEWLYLGVIDVGEMRRRLSNIGYPTSEIDRIIAAAIFRQQRKAPPNTQTPHGKGGRGGLAKASELTKAEIKSALGLNLRDEAWARLQLSALGLDGNDVDVLIELWKAGG